MRTGSVSQCGTFLLFLLLVVAAASCRHADPERAYFPSPRPVIDYRPASAAERKANRIRRDVPEGVSFVAGWSVENRPIHYRVYGRGSELVLVLGAIHGNEPAGARLVRHLARYLEENPGLIEGRTVALCAVANPDGLARGIRWNARGIDLNRNYPTANFRASRRNGSLPLCEPESRAVDDLVTLLRPARVLSIHQPLECIDPDGPARELAEAMRRHTHLPVKKLGLRPGSLGSYVGEKLGIPIITLELPASAEDRPVEDLWWLYRRTVLAFIRFPDAPDAPAAAEAPPGVGRGPAIP